MTGRRTNLGLLAFLVLALATGGLAYAIGSSVVRWIVAVHGVAGLGLVVLAPWKSSIVRRGLARLSPGRTASLALVALSTLTVVSGILHSSGLLVSVGAVTAMQVHVASSLVLLPLALWHVARRPVRMRRTDVSRRSLLRAGAVAGAGVLAYAGAEHVVRALSLPGAERRFTGSHEEGSFGPETMPVTQWLNDPVPAVDPDTWSLTVSARDDTREWSLEELVDFDDGLRAVIDCTGGWFATQDWGGVRLDRLIPADLEARSLLVRSLTGYSRRFPIEDAPRLMLATRVGGAELSAGHGFPARIVAPGRRGFWWVKWVTAIEASETPWWWQPPFPLA